MTEVKQNKRNKAFRLLFAFVLACLWCIGANSPNTDTPKAMQNISIKQAIQGVKSEWGSYNETTNELIQNCEQITLSYSIKNPTTNVINIITNNINPDTLKYLDSFNLLDYIYNPSTNSKWPRNYLISNFQASFMYHNKIINSVNLYTNALGLFVNIWDEEEGYAVENTIFWDERAQSNSMTYAKLLINQETESIFLRWSPSLSMTIQSLIDTNFGGFIVGQYKDETTLGEYYFSQGQNSVLNNPNEHNLFTSTQIQNAKDEGYQKGLDEGSKEGYSFLGLFKSVIQAPMYFIESAFNVEIFGFNLGQVIKTIIFLVVVAVSTTIILKVVSK